MSDKIVLAYSGGLDTSVAVRWLSQEYNFEVIAVTVDVGNEKDFTLIHQKALDVGAIESHVINAQEALVNEYVFPALKANAIYQGEYPLATALNRPLIARILVDIAHEKGARAIAHGCTGKGNDQVRLEVGMNTLGPDLTIIAPAREWGMSREELIDYARKHNIPVPVTVDKPYSIDECLWGRAIECGVLEDPWNEPPEDIYEWTKSADDAPDKPRYIEIGFLKGVPRTLDGEELDGITLINRLNDIAGEHGVGRIDHIEDRRVGIKSHEIYEAPAAITLLAAHRAIESLVMSRAQRRFADTVSQEYSNLVYDGLWFSGLHRDLTACVESSQTFVTGLARLKLHRGNCSVVGRKSPFSLYDYGLATYDKNDSFDPSFAQGFINLWGLEAKTQARMQMLRQESKNAGGE
jgi:argininosuccinate synthase